MPVAQQLQWIILSLLFVGNMCVITDSPLASGTLQTTLSGNL